MNNLSYAVGLDDDGFTLLPAWVSFPAVTSTVSVGRQGLSIQDSRKHESEVPARQAFKHGGAVHHFGRIGWHAVSSLAAFFLRQRGPAILRNPAQSFSTVVCAMQREMPFLSAAPSPVAAPHELIAACRHRLDAIRLCIQLSRLPLNRVSEELGIDCGHMTRIMQGRAHFPDAKSCDLMRLCGNIAPMQYEAHAMGYELAHDEKAERVRQLKAELAALEAAA